MPGGHGAKGRIAPSLAAASDVAGGSDVDTCADGVTQSSLATKSAPTAAEETLPLAPDFDSG